MLDLETHLCCLEMRRSDYIVFAIEWQYALHGLVEGDYWNSTCLHYSALE